MKTPIYSCCTAHSLVRVFWALGVCAWVAGCEGGRQDLTSPSLPPSGPDREGVYQVYPGQDLQAALDSAAQDATNKTVRVHAGTYRPQRPAQAFISFEREHDGITLEAAGEVILTATNEKIADVSQGFPAIVNHVVYFGDGVSERTVLRGFRITGANNYVAKVERPQLERLRHSSGPGPMLFYTDGGGIKIFGRSYPTIVDVEIYGNYTSPCGAGVSVEHADFNDRSVTLKNCIFRDNRCQITGAAVDLLPGSAAVIENCLFVGNVSNTGPATMGTPEDHNGDRGSGALTVFRGSRIKVDRCTFTGNWNGADDKGDQNIYTNTIFWMNSKSGGIYRGQRYELDILDARQVSGCFLNGELEDPRRTIDRDRNTFNAPDPEFDAEFRPQAAGYENVGYRPVTRNSR